MPDQNEEEMAEELTESMTWTYNGEEKTATAFLGESWTSSGGTDFETRRLYIEAQDASGERIKVTMINALDLGDGECPVLMTYQVGIDDQDCGQSEGGYSFCQEGRISLLKSNKAYNDQDKSGEVILTSCIVEDKLATGTFRGSVERTLDDGTVDILEISGEFKNIEFVKL